MKPDGSTEEEGCSGTYPEHYGFIVSGDAQFHFAKWAGKGAVVTNDTRAV